MFDLFDFENTTPSRNYGSNARRGVLEYVDHCFGTLRVPYLSLIFLLRYIVNSPLFLVIYGSELKVTTYTLWYEKLFPAAWIPDSRTCQPAVIKLNER